MVQHPCPQQVEVSTPVHLPLDHLQAMDLPFDLPLTPLITERRPDGPDIIGQPVGEAHQLRYLTPLRVDEPLSQLVATTPSDHGDEAQCQLLGAPHLGREPA